MRRSAAASGDWSRQLAYALPIVRSEVGGGRVYALSGLILQSGALFICDTHVNHEPTAEQIAEMTLLAAEEVRRFGVVPKAALLSHSSFGASDSPSARKMRRALALIRARAPDLEVDGEMHADAALSAPLRDRLVADSPLEGAANLLVMPNLDAANIGLTLLGASASGLQVGPMLLGLQKPLHVLVQQRHGARHRQHDGAGRRRGRQRRGDASPPAPASADGLRTRLTVEGGAETPFPPRAAVATVVAKSEGDGDHECGRPARPDRGAAPSLVQAALRPGADRHRDRRRCSGIVAPGRPGAAMKPLGDAFVNLIRMMIAPGHLLHGGARHRHDGRPQARRPGRRQGAGLFRGRVDPGARRRPHRGRGRPARAPASTSTRKTLDPKSVANYISAAKGDSVMAHLLAIIPTSFVDAFAKGDLLQVLLVAILTGIAVSRLGDDRRADRGRHRRRRQDVLPHHRHHRPLRARSAPSAPWRSRSGRSASRAWPTSAR